MSRLIATTSLVVLVLSACSNGKHSSSSEVKAPPATPAQASAPADPAATDDVVSKLRAGDMMGAATAAASVLASEPGNSRAATALALTRYFDLGERLFTDLLSVVDGADGGRLLDHERMRAAYQRTADGLAEIDSKLAIAGKDAGFELELCLACWERDWNANGRVDDSDRHLLELEVDATGEELPATDPRRRPTFRFDQGDIFWARAMVSFQRALLEVILAYRWTELDKLLDGEPRGKVKIVLPLTDAARLKRAQSLILAGLGHAERSRQLYLAETDDDREWLPNPSQKSHPLPLPVDAALYQTWSDLLGDIRRLLDSSEGLGLRATAMVVDDDFAVLPEGYVDIGSLFSKPTDLVFDIAVLDQMDADSPASIEAGVRSLLGEHFVRKMKPSPLPERLARMRRDLERGDDTLERKLRYLLWLN